MYAHTPPHPTPSLLYPDAEPSGPDSQICAGSHFVAVPLAYSLPRHLHLEPSGMEVGGKVPAGTESGITFPQGRGTVHKPSGCSPLESRLQPQTQVELVEVSVGFPGGSEGKESACNAGDLDSIPGLGRYPGERNGLPTPVFWTGESMDRGAWRAIVHGVTKSQT